MRFRVRCHLLFGLLALLQFGCALEKRSKRDHTFALQTKVENLIEKILNVIQDYYNQVRTELKCIPEDVPDTIIHTLKKSIDCVDVNERSYDSGQISPNIHKKNFLKCFADAKKEVQDTIMGINPTLDYCPENMTEKTYQINITTSFTKTFHINIKNGLEIMKKEIKMGNREKTCVFNQGKELTNDKNQNHNHSLYDTESEIADHVNASSYENNIVHEYGDYYDDSNESKNLGLIQDIAPESKEHSVYGSNEDKSEHYHLVSDFDEYDYDEDDNENISENLDSMGNIENDQGSNEDLDKGSKLEKEHEKNMDKKEQNKKDLDSKQHHGLKETKEYNGKNFESKEHQGKVLSSKEKHGKANDSKELQKKGRDSKEHHSKFINSKEQRGKNPNLKEKNGKGPESKEEHGKNHNLKEHHDKVPNSKEEHGKNHNLKEHHDKVQNSKEEHGKNHNLKEHHDKVPNSKEEHGKNHNLKEQHDKVPNSKEEHGKNHNLKEQHDKVPNSKEEHGKNHNLKEHHNKVPNSKEEHGKNHNLKEHHDKVPNSKEEHGKNHNLKEHQDNVANPVKLQANYPHSNEKNSKNIHLENSEHYLNEDEPEDKPARHLSDYNEGNNLGNENNDDGSDHLLMEHSENIQDSNDQLGRDPDSTEQHGKDSKVYQNKNPHYMKQPGKTIDSKEHHGKDAGAGITEDEFEHKPDHYNSDHDIAKYDQDDEDNDSDSKNHHKQVSISKEQHEGNKLNVKEHLDKGPADFLDNDSDSGNYEDDDHSSEDNFEHNPVNENNDGKYSGNDEDENIESKGHHEGPDPKETSEKDLHSKELHEAGHHSSEYHDQDSGDLMENYYDAHEDDDTIDGDGADDFYNEDSDYITDNNDHIEESSKVKNNEKETEGNNHVSHEFGSVADDSNIHNEENKGDDGYDDDNDEDDDDDDDMKFNNGKVFFPKTIIKDKFNIEQNPERTTLPAAESTTKSDYYTDLDLKPEDFGNENKDYKQTEKEKNFTQIDDREESLYDIDHEERKMKALQKERPRIQLKPRNQFKPKPKKLQQTTVRQRIKLPEKINQEPPPPKSRGVSFENMAQSFSQYDF